MIKNFLNWIQQNKPFSIYLFTYSIITGFSLSYIVYAMFFQRHFFSWRYFFYSVCLFILSSFILGLININFLFEKINQLKIQRKILLIAFSILSSTMLLINTPIQPIYYLLPDSEFKISFEIDEIAEASSEVQLLWINTGQGFLHHSNLAITGEYEIVDSKLIFHPGQKVDIFWKGKAGPNSEIVFGSTPYDQDISIQWNGEATKINLMGKDGETFTFTSTTSTPTLLKLFFIFSYLILFSYLSALCILALTLWKPKSNGGHNDRSYSWILFMLPMLLIWVFSLLVFWPGAFTNDSSDLWRQAVTGNFNDWQSAFYSIVLYLLVRIRYSLSFIMILQILFFSLVTANGLGRFEKRGVPKPILWIISIFFAISPLNNMQVITLWKDIPYAVSFLWLTILFFEIFDSNGVWIAQKKNVVVILIVSLLISLLRQNGFPVVAVSLLILSFVYKRMRRQYLAVLIGVISIFVLIKGPIYDLIGIDRGRSGQSNLILLHHIAAHLDAGTDIKGDEMEYLNSLLPIQDWDYQCCYIVPIYLNKGFNEAELMSNSVYNRKLAFSLFLRDPIVDIRHAFCAGELAWRFGGMNKCNINSTHGLNTWRAGKQDWIIPNEFSLTESSYIPGLVQKYSDILRTFGFQDELLVPYLRPAFYFYLFILSLVIAYFRNNDWKVFIIGLPIILQTLLLFLINFAPVIRYFYSTNLVGVLFIGIIFYQRDMTVKEKF
jgi:hypothetical protein